jgi:hypothetical protein
LEEELPTILATPGSVKRYVPYAMPKVRVVDLDEPAKISFSSALQMPERDRHQLYGFKP